MMDHYEIIEFYLGLVRRAQARGIRCAITSGMACVAFEVAEATKDCDLLCDPDAADPFLQLLAETSAQESPCRYRGKISPPLDARWLKGGWTSHFEWPGTEAYLDVFGIAPRARSSWLEEMIPPYAHPHVVADMKRTGRDKDWPFLTALGVRMVESGDPRGWLHIYDDERMGDLLAKQPGLPREIVAARPVLALVVSGAPGLAAALRLERAFWQELSKLRVREYERLLRPYVVAVRKASAGRQTSLFEDHALRVECAAAHLPPRPLNPQNLERMIVAAKEAILFAMKPEMAGWLPSVTANFALLIPELK